MKKLIFFLTVLSGIHTHLHALTCIIKNETDYPVRVSAKQGTCPQQAGADKGAEVVSEPVSIEKRESYTATLAPAISYTHIEGTIVIDGKEVALVPWDCASSSASLNKDEDCVWSIKMNDQGSATIIQVAAPIPPIPTVYRK